MKKEVYSWRLTTELRADLEREARFRKMSVSSLLEMAVRGWLKNRPEGAVDDEEQRRLHAAAEKCLGAFAGRNPRRSETARQAIREHLRRRRAR
jgi:hypothetical protein